VDPGNEIEHRTSTSWRYDGASKDNFRFVDQSKQIIFFFVSEFSEVDDIFRVFLSSWLMNTITDTNKYGKHNYHYNGNNLLASDIKYK